MTNSTIIEPIGQMGKHIPTVMIMILGLIVITWFLGRFVFKDQEEEGEDGKSI